MDVLTRVIKKLRSPTLPDLGIVLLVLLLFSSSLNIAYHLFSDFAYVDGGFINYRDVVVHIVDISVVCLLVWMAVCGKVWDSVFVRVGAIVLVFFVVFHVMMHLNPAVFHVVMHPDGAVFYGTLRLYLYSMCWLLLGEWLYRCLVRGTCRRVGPVRRWVVGVLIVAGVIQAGIGIVQFLNNRMLGIDVLGESIVQVGGYGASSVFLPIGTRLRAYGTFPHPNLLAGFLVAVFIVGIFTRNIWRGVWGGKMKYIMTVSLLLISAGIWVTWSRAALVVWAVVLVIAGGMYIRKRRGKRKAMWFLAGFIFALVCTGIWVGFGKDTLSSSVRERFITQSSSTDVSVIHRHELNERAVEMFLENPDVGVGILGFTEKLAEKPLFDENGIRVMQPAHSVPLLVLAEVGMWGVLCLLAFCVMLYRRVKPSGYLLAVAVYLAAAMLLDHYLWSLPQGLAIWGILLTGGVIVESVELEDD